MEEPPKNNIPKYVQKTVNSVEQKKITNPNSVEPDNNQNQTFLNSDRKSKTKQTYTGPEEPTRDYRLQKLCSKNIQDQLEELAIKTNSIPVPEETKTVPITNEELSTFVYLKKDLNVCIQIDQRKLPELSG